MDIVNANRAAYAAFVDVYGWDALLTALNTFAAPGFDLYSVSKDWHDRPEGRYVLKAKGARGDLLVTFAD